MHYLPIAVTESGIVISVKLSQLPIHLLLSHKFPMIRTHILPLYMLVFPIIPQKRKKRLFENIL